MTTGKDSSWLQRLNQMTWLGRVLTLLAVMFLAFLVATPVALYTCGRDGMVAAAVALVICLLGGLGSLLVCELFRDPNLVLYRVLIGTMLRMGLPLGLFLVVYYRGGTLVEAGVGFYVIGFYLIMLTTETLMLVPDTRATGAKAKPS